MELVKFKLEPTASSRQTHLSQIFSGVSKLLRAVLERFWSNAVQNSISLC
jgi:hypothetical protein